MSWSKVLEEPYRKRLTASSGFAVTPSGDAPPSGEVSPRRDSKRRAVHDYVVVLMSRSDGETENTT